MSNASSRRKRRNYLYELVGYFLKVNGVLLFRQAISGNPKVIVDTDEKTVQGLFGKRVKIGVLSVELRNGKKTINDFELIC